MGNTEVTASKAVRLLIVAHDDRLAGPLAAGLEPLGWPAAIVRGSEAAVAALRRSPVDAVLIDMSHESAELRATAAILKAAASPRRLPVVALGRPDPLLERWAFDLSLGTPLHPSQAAMRLEALARASVAEEEFDLRNRTFAERGHAPRPPRSNPGPLQILTMGEPAPKFLALSHALKRGEGEEETTITAALTAYTAFDYMHERRFDAVVLWAGETHAEALSIAGGMRRNSRLFHLPTVLYVREGVQIDPADAFHRGLSDVASADTPEDETARRVLSLARSYRRETAIRQALEQVRSSGLMDAATGLFTRDLFALHLGRLAEASRERRRPLSLAVLRIADRAETGRVRSGGWVDRAIPQIGSMISRLVRAEDTAARLAPEVFALALPAAGQAAAKIASERIAAVIACTAFEAGPGAAPFTVEFTLGVAQLEPGEAPGRTLERAAARALSRQAG